MDYLVENMETIVESPSSRRAWIEIRSKRMQTAGSSVALLAEGVDRNSRRDCTQMTRQLSPSSRRAWIEIFWRSCIWREVESPSSRRAWIEICCAGSRSHGQAGRPPRGGRG